MGLAGAVEGVLGWAGEAAGGQDGVFVAAGAGVVGGEASTVGGSCVAQAHGLEGIAVGQFTVGVGEGAAMADVRARQLRPGA